MERALYQRMQQQTLETAGLLRQPPHSLFGPTSSSALDGPTQQPLPHPYGVRIFVLYGCDRPALLRACDSGGGGGEWYCVCGLRCVVSKDADDDGVEQREGKEVVGRP